MTTTRLQTETYMLKLCADTDARCLAFLLRTKLPISEINIVYINGKGFPQWTEAVKLLPKAFVFND